MLERLQKVLARAGVASRRKAEELITAGQVEVNGRKVTELGTRVDAAKDTIRVDGRLVADVEDRVYFVLYKPAGCVTTLSDPEGRPTVKDYVRAIPERVYPVGRLDYDAEGALILTNDGDLAHKLMHPRFGARRTYLAKVKGEPGRAVLERLRAGVRLEDGLATPVEVELVSRADRNTWVRLVVAEGRPHLVKRLCEAVGHPVQRLFRASYAGLSVEGMMPGELRALSNAEVRQLRGGHLREDARPPLPPRRDARRGGGGPSRGRFVGGGAGWGAQGGAERGTTGGAAEETRPERGTEGRPKPSFKARAGDERTSGSRGGGRPAPSKKPGRGGGKRPTGGRPGGRGGSKPRTGAPRRTRPRG